MSEMASMLDAFYGRVFLPRYSVKRVFGRFELFGGLPGLHPINFFGNPLVKHLNLDGIRALSDVEVQETAASVLVNFVNRSSEFTRAELENLQPVFGENIFRGFDDRPPSPVQMSFIRWWFETLSENRHYRRDTRIFDCDLEPSN